MNATDQVDTPKTDDQIKVWRAAYWDGPFQAAKNYLCEEVLRLRKLVTDPQAFTDDQGVLIQLMTDAQLEVVWQAKYHDLEHMEYRKVFEQAIAANAMNKRLLLQATVNKALISAATDNATTWDELMDIIQRELHEKYPNAAENDICSIDEVLLGRYCLRFPHFADRLREYTKNWNDLERAIPAAIEAIKIEPEELEAMTERGMKRVAFLMRFYSKHNAMEARIKEPMNASAPVGCKCADCTMGEEPCPTCYQTWWKKKNPNVNVVSADDTELFDAQQRVDLLVAQCHLVCESDNDNIVRAGYIEALKDHLKNFPPVTIIDMK